MGSKETIHWDKEKVKNYFDECNRRYEKYYTGLEELERAFRGFVSDDWHEGDEAESANLFVKKVMIPMVNEIIRVIRILQTKQEKLIDEFPDSADNAILDEAHLSKVIKDFSAFLRSYKDISSQIREIAIALNTECTNGGMFRYRYPWVYDGSPSPSSNKIFDPVDPLPMDFGDQEPWMYDLPYNKPLWDLIECAFASMTDEDGKTGDVPRLKNNLINFDTDHQYDFGVGTEFYSLIELISTNIERIKNAAQGSDLEMVIKGYKYNTALQKAIIEPKDMLGKEQLYFYNKYILQLEKYLKGQVDRVTVFGSDPVNMTEGNYVADHEDIKINGIPSLSFSRYYNARSEYVSVMGRGWSHTYDQKLTVYTDENSGDTEYITVSKADGGELLYFKQNDGTITQEAHGEPEILKKSGSSWVMIFPDGKKAHFGKNGWLKDLVYMSGGKVKIVRDPEHLERVLRVSSINGNELIFTYDESGFLSSVADQTGRSVKYGYSDGDLTEVYELSGSIRHISYDDEHRLCSIGRDDEPKRVRNVYGADGRISKQSYADGSSVEFKYDDEKGETIYTEQNGNVIRYLRDDKRRHIATIYTNGTEYFKYDDRNNRISYTDRMGNTTRFTYDDHDRLTGVINALGEKSSVTYDSEGHIYAFKEANGAEWRFWYDSKGNVIKVKNSENHIAQFEYDPLGQCTKIQYPDGSCMNMKYVMGCLTEISYADGSKRVFEYNDRKKCIAETDPEGGRTEYSYDEAGNVTSVTDPLGNITRYTYNSSGDILCVIYPDGTKKVNEYNSIGKLSGFTDENGNRTVITYNNMFRESERILPNGGHIMKEYDAFMNVVCETDAVGNSYKYTYDPLGNILTESSNDRLVREYEYDDLGRIISEKNGNGQIKRFEYDPSGNLIAEIDAAGNHTKYEYDSMHHMISKVDANGNVTLKKYDSMGRISSETDENGKGYSYRYDKRGNLIEIDFCGKTQEIRDYNANRKITSRKISDGFSYKYIYDAASRLVEILDSCGRSIKLGYDRRGRIIEKNDNGRITYYTYYADGKIRSVTDANGHTTEYERNEIGKISAIRSLDDGSRTTKYEYDLMGRLLATINALGESNRYEYDALGRLISKVDRDDKRTDYDYDDAGYLTNILYSDGKAVHFSFDELGHISGFTDWTGRTGMVCDAAGNLKEITYPTGQTAAFEYTVTGDRKSILYPDGSHADYIYDERNRLIKLVNGDRSVKYFYDDLDRLVKKEYPNGICAIYEYYKGGKIRSMTSKDDQGVLDQNEYFYNVNSECEKIRRFRRNMPEASGVFSYKYDMMGHLTDIEKDGEILRKFRYDAFGNRILMEEANNCTSYQYDVLDRLVESTDKRSDGLISRTCFKYDERGNLTEVVKDDNLQKYVYDVAGMMVKASNSAGDSREYTYNGLGFRVADKVSHSDPERCDDINEYLCDLSRDSYNLLQFTHNGEKEQFLWDDNVIGLNHGNDDYYFVRDVIGSPAYLTGANGKVVSAYSFDEFGREDFTGKRSENTSVVQPFSFTGYLKDEISGLHFAQARYYDPKNGRFISEDQVRGTTIDPESQNHYIYCRNKVLDHVDPNGKTTVTVKLGGSIFYYLGVGGDIDLSIDDEFNVAVQGSASGLVPNGDFMVGINAGVSGALQVQYTTLDRVNDLEGPSTAIGASGGEIGRVGFDFIIAKPFFESSIKDLKGFQLGVGFGAAAPAEIHLGQGNTSKSWYWVKEKEDGTICLK
ncbi:RHS repeat-associated core domain-containing protein [Lachnospiraceae bacterium]|nr:RHS repeat-associated core domain-containing protein [Lachnospiraceae bacterium]